MNQRRVYKLIKDVPMLKKGLFVFYDYTGHVHWIDENGKETEYPLRTGLAGYLWLLRTEPRFFKFIESEPEDLGD